MGEAILSAILDNELATPGEITVSDIDGSRCQYLQQNYSVTTISDNRQVVAGADILLLAVKPQSLPEVLPGLKGKLEPDQLVISIIAGARIDYLSGELNHLCIVRAMPNTPAQIGKGITVWTATTAVTEEQKGMAGSILGGMGKEIYVNDEKMIDMATAVSGSGPAYLFLYIESMVEAAVKIGLPGDIAQELVLETVLGAGHLVEESGKEPAELRRMVTSPGGTTAEAIQKFEQGNFSELVAQAVRAAFEKAKSLGNS